MTHRNQRRCLLRRLNPRKIATQKAAIVFAPRTARSLLSDLFDAVNGGAIYRHASFLAGKLGEKIASESLTVIDDATLPGAAPRAQTDVRPEDPGDYDLDDLQSAPEAIVSPEQRLLEAFPGAEEVSS